ncbi:hypothetical protein ABZ297_38880, partial [Nonomuraea sp. NPDC005983]|uniref:hypothetical protein n=1 Tax=Nonomuraea sp. NPDC005983 TaxID=3155595 RepID=UPI0033B8579C
AATALLGVLAVGAPMLQTAAQPLQQATTAARPAATQPATMGSAPAKPTPKLPERFTAPDGTEYRLVADSRIMLAGGTKATVTVPVTGKPLAMGAVCTGSDDSGPRVSTGERMFPPAAFTVCSRHLALQPLVVPKGAKQVTVTVDDTTRGRGCVWDKARNTCEPQQPKRGTWFLAAYEWMPPAKPVDPGEPKPFPAKVSGWKLAETKTGTFPQDATATFHLEGGHSYGLDQLCTGDLASSLRFSYLGAITGVVGSCGVWESGPWPYAMNEVRVPKGQRLRVSIRLSMPGEVGNRPVRWSVGLFRK